MSGGASSRTTWRARAVFLAYAAAVTVATHWPQLRLPARLIPRPDLVLHVMVFGAWSFLCVRAGWFGRRHSARNVVLSGGVSIVYAAVDEATQAIEALHRHARWDDFGANLFGVAVGLAVAMTLAALEDDRSES